MSRARVFVIYVAVDLLIAAGVVWGAFNRWPAREYIVPAGVLFVINGVWLVVMTVRETPRE